MSRSAQKSHVWNPCSLGDSGVGGQFPKKDFLLRITLCVQICKKVLFALPPNGVGWVFGLKYQRIFYGNCMKYHDLHRKIMNGIPNLFGWGWCWVNFHIIVFAGNYIECPDLYRKSCFQLPPPWDERQIFAMNCIEYQDLHRKACMDSLVPGLAGSRELISKKCFVRN